MKLTVRQREILKAMAEGQLLQFDAPCGTLWLKHRKIRGGRRLYTIFAEGGFIVQTRERPSLSDYQLTEKGKEAINESQ